MTPTQRRLYSRKYQSLQKAIELKFVSPVKRALDKQVAAMLDVYLSGGHVDMMLFNEHISPVIRRLYLAAGLANASKMRGEIRTFRQEKSGFGTNDELINAVIDYLTKYLLSKSVRSISETTKTWVLDQISKGEREGLGAVEIAKRIQGAEFTKMQSLRIVRTETVRATNAGAKAAMDASPFEVQKEWIAAHDNRTRHSHKALDGQVRDIDEEFKPGLQQPGDPNADASETINCRCTIASKAKRDANGRLIRKPVIMPVGSPNRMREFLTAV